MDLKELLGEAYKEGMTLEEVEAALKNITPPAPDTSAAEVTRLKNALSKANSQAADLKQQLRNKQTQEEADAAAKQEEYDKLVQENADLKRSQALAEKKAQLLGMGYEAALAESTATAMVDGDMDTVMKNQSQFLEAQKKDILADKMKKTPGPLPVLRVPARWTIRRRLRKPRPAATTLPPPTIPVWRHKPKPRRSKSRKGVTYHG